MSLGSIFKAIAPAIPIVGPVLSYLGQRQANKANTAQAAAMMSFQERMSGSSYQRGVADMEAAGLNPMLAYSQGGASSPGGAQAVMGNEEQAAVTAAREGALMQAEIDLKEAQAQSARADAKIKSFPGTVSETAARGVEEIKGGLRSGVDAVIEKGAPVVESVIGGLSSAGGAIRDRYSTTMGDAVDLIRAAPSKVRDAAHSSAGAVRRVYEELKENVSSGRRDYNDVEPAFKRELKGKMRGKLGGASQTFSKHR